MFLKISKVCIGLAFFAFGAGIAALGAATIDEGVRGTGGLGETATAAEPIKAAA